MKKFFSYFFLLLALAWTPAAIAQVVIPWTDVDKTGSAASTTGAGLVELATSDETYFGFDASRAITAASLNYKNGQQDYRELKSAILASIRGKLAYGKKINSLHYGDSLVNGSSGGSYMSTFWSAWERLLGSGGGGFYDAFSNAGGRDMIAATQAGSWWDTNQINWGANGWNFVSTADTVGDGRFGFSGRYLYQSAGNGTQLLRIRTPRHPFTRATLFYLEKSGGGTFSFGKTGDVVSVDTAAGSSALKSISRRIWTGTIDDNEVLVSNVTGAVVLYGVLLENDEVGGFVSVGGAGGHKAETFAALDATSYTSYVRALDPVAVFFNLGTNDAGTSAASYKGFMQTLITRVRAADSAVPIVLQVPYGGNIPANYLTVLAELTTENSNVFTCKWEDALGAGGAGFIFDSIHPNQAGCAMLGKFFVEVSGGDAIPSPRSIWPFRNAFNVRDSLFTNPARNSTFTAAATDWAGSSGGSVTYVQGTGVQVTSAGAFSGAQIDMTANAATLKAGRLYHIRMRLSVGSGALLYTQSGAWPLTWPAVSSIATTGQISAANTDHIHVMRPPADITMIRVLHPGAGASFTISLFEVREIPESDEPYAAYAAGTAYALTASSAAIDFGTTDPIITIARPGTYILRARVNLKYTGATFSANRNVTLKLRRTNNTATDVANSSTVVVTGVVTTTTGTMATVELPAVSYTTGSIGDSITVYADVSALPSAGTLDVVEASITATRIP